MVRKFLVTAASFAMIGLGNVHAVVFFSTGTSTKNTTAPGGALAGSGWQFQGQWGATLGTTIAPNHFITAAHIGGTVGDTFVFSGSSYTTTAVFDDPNSDLRIWQVDGTFSTYAPLYTGSSEVGKEVVFFGRGAQRGTEVVLSGTSKGWEWGTADAVQRWGQNEVAAIASGLPVYGDSLLAMAFDADGVDDEEATYSFGDSGGGVFILDAGTWKLAGINSWADGPYGLTSNPSDGNFLGSLYDQDGYYADTLYNSWEQVSGPGMVYASRISTSEAWIFSVIPEPTSGMLVFAALIMGCGRRRLICRR